MGGNLKKWLSLTDNTEPSLDWKIYFFSQTQLLSSTAANYYYRLYERILLYDRLYYTTWLLADCFAKMKNGVNLIYSEHLKHVRIKLLFIPTLCMAAFSFKACLEILTSTPVSKNYSDAVRVMNYKYRC